MNAFYFKDWENALATEPQKTAFGITTRWYLSYLRSHNTVATIESARRFVAEAIGSAANAYPPHEPANRGVPHRLVAPPSSA